MKNSILYIFGAVALLGGGAFLFLKNKKNKDKEKLALAELQSVTEETAKATPTEKPISGNDMIEIIKLKDYITERANAINNYKKQSSRDAVKEDIKKNLEKLKVYGYTLDNKRQLIKIAI